MLEGDGLTKLENADLDYKILRWFNNRMVDMFLDRCELAEWGADWLQYCFPRKRIYDIYYNGEYRNGN